MRIGEIFRNPINRHIEEVIKVDFNEAETVAAEIEEYVVTDNILRSLEDVLDRYQESILKPNEETNLWISGFFGSGKSSFAKMLGYVLENPGIAGRSAVERFLERVGEPKVAALLNTIQAQAPAVTVFVDLATSKDVVREGESMVLPLYRALLERLGYARNILLAELEYDLETDGELAAFIDVFDQLPDGHGRWHERRNAGLARGEASRAMQVLRPETYPHADSWSRSAAEPVVNANWFADRAVELLRRRGAGATRLVFVVDEVGQYVARSVQRMLDLQGLAEAAQKKRGKLWLAVTSQEKLDDVLDSLEGRLIELARVQSRFPLKVDLLPSDIDEVTGKRVLEKNEAGQQAVRSALAPYRNQMAQSVRLESPRRALDLDEDAFVRLYPLVPYQVQLLIDAVSARRAQGGGGPMLGGSNRTIIKLAQQLVVNRPSGIGELDVGHLVTLDRAYDLLRSVIPTAWRAEIEQVEERLGAGSIEVRLAKVVALCMDVPALPLNARNLAVLLHPAVGAEDLRDEVARALDILEQEEVLRPGEHGYRLQSPQEKDWEKTRRAIQARPADRVRLRRELLAQKLRGLSVTAARTFKVAVLVEGERVLDGDLTLAIDEPHAGAVAAVQVCSRDADQESVVWWVYDEAAATYETIGELYRSKQMIARRDTPGKSATDAELLGEERIRLARLEPKALRQLSEDLLAGSVIFRGQVEDPPRRDLAAAAQEVLARRVPDVYPQLQRFAAPVKRDDVLALIRADNLRGLPDYLADSGIGLLETTPEGVQIAADRDPLAAVVAEIERRATYGQEATGAHLERKFGDSPYGAPVEVVQALVAAGIRAGIVEAVAQGARLARADDPRLEKVFNTLPAFRSAAFRRQISDVPLEVRTALAEKLTALTGKQQPIHVEALSRSVRDAFLGDLSPAREVGSTLTVLGLSVPDPVTRSTELLTRLAEGTDADTIRTAHDAWQDLMSGTRAVRKLHEVLGRELPTLRQAVTEVRLGDVDLPPAQREDRQRLADYLGAGDFAEHMGEVRAITERLSATRAEGAAAARAALQAAVGEARQSLHQEYAGRGHDGLLDEELRSLEALMPPNDAAVAAADLAARQDAVPARVAALRRRMEEYIQDVAVERIDVRQVVGGPIATEADLQRALSRIEAAAQAVLADGKVVELG